MSLGVVVGRSGTWHPPPPPPPQTLTRKFSKYKKSGWSLGVVVGGSEHHFNHFWHILHLRGWLHISWRHKNVNMTCILGDFNLIFKNFIICGEDLAKFSIATEVTKTKKIRKHRLLTNLLIFDQMHRNSTANAITEKGIV